MSSLLGVRFVFLSVGGFYPVVDGGVAIEGGADSVVSLKGGLKGRQEIGWVAACVAVSLLSLVSRSGFLSLGA